MAPAYEVSGAPPGGEVIPEPYGWMGQTNLNWWGLWVLAPCLGGKVFILPPPGGGKFTALRAWELAVLVRAGRGTMTAFVTMERAGLVPQGGKIESLTNRAERVAAGVRPYNEKPKATKRTVEVDGEEINTPALAFADDLWLGAYTAQDLQYTLSLVSQFLGLYGVELHPKKSFYVPVNVKRQGKNNNIGLWRETEGQRQFVPLPIVAQSEACRYLGIWLQADGGWDTMTQVVKDKVKGWTRAVVKHKLPLHHAVMALRSTVGGLLRYVLTAAPLSESALVEIDRMVAKALWASAGVAQRRSTAWAFLTQKDGGLGALSVVQLQRELAITEGLTALNWAADSPKTAGLANNTLAALDDRRRDGGVAGEFLSPEAGRATLQKDCLDGMRHALAQLGWSITDNRTRRWSRRRRDISLESLLQNSPASVGKSLRSFQQLHDSPIFLGEVASANGAHLHTAQALGYVGGGRYGFGTWRISSGSRRSKGSSTRNGKCPTWPQEQRAARPNSWERIEGCSQKFICNTLRPGSCVRRRHPWGRHISLYLTAQEGEQ